MERLRSGRSKLFLSGGGLKIYQFLGALDALGAGRRGRFRTFTGVSAGGFACLLLSLGLDAAAVLRELDGLDVPGLLHASFDVARLCSTGAPLEGQVVLRKLQERLLQLGCPVNATFAWHARATNCELRLVAADAASASLVAFCAASTPDVQLARAALASMALPLLLPPVRVAGRLYVDAAVLNNAPVHLAGDAARLLCLVTELGGGGGAAGLGLGLSCCVAEDASLAAARDAGALVLTMPAVPPNAHALCVDPAARRVLLRQGRDAATARTLECWLAGMLVLLAAPRPPIARWPFSARLLQVSWLRRGRARHVASYAQQPHR